MEPMCPEEVVSEEGHDDGGHSALQGVCHGPSSAVVDGNLDPGEEPDGKPQGGRAAHGGQECVKSGRLGRRDLLVVGVTACPCWAWVGAVLGLPFGILDTRRTVLCSGSEAAMD